MRFLCTWNGRVQIMLYDLSPGLALIRIRSGSLFYMSHRFGPISIIVPLARAFLMAQWPTRSTRTFRAFTRPSRPWTGKFDENYDFYESKLKRNCNLQQLLLVIVERRVWEKVLLRRWRSLWVLMCMERVGSRVRLVVIAKRYWRMIISFNWRSRMPYVMSMWEVLSHFKVQCDSDRARWGRSWLQCKFENLFLLKFELFLSIIWLLIIFID